MEGRGLESTGVAICEFDRGCYEAKLCLLLILCVSPSLHSSVPIGSLAHYSAAEILENLSAALPKVVGKIPFGGWDNVQNVEVKTGKSASLPVWNVDLQDRWTGIEEAEDEPMISDEEEEEEVEESSEEEEGKVAPPPKKAKATPATAGAQPKKTKSSTQTDVVKPAVKKQTAVDGKIKKAKK